MTHWVREREEATMVVCQKSSSSRTPKRWSRHQRRMWKQTLRKAHYLFEAELEAEWEAECDAYIDAHHRIYLLEHQAEQLPSHDVDGKKRAEYVHGKLRKLIDGDLKAALSLTDMLQKGNLTRDEALLYDDVYLFLEKKVQCFCAD